MFEDISRRYADYVASTAICNSYTVLIWKDLLYTFVFPMVKSRYRNCSPSNISICCFTTSWSICARYSKPGGQPANPWGLFIHPAKVISRVSTVYHFSSISRHLWTCCSNKQSYNKLAANVVGTCADAGNAQISWVDLHLKTHLPSSKKFPQTDGLNAIFPFFYCTVFYMKRLVFHYS